VWPVIRMFATDTDGEKPNNLLKIAEGYEKTWEES